MSKTLRFDVQGQESRVIGFGVSLISRRGFTDIARGTKRSREMAMIDSYFPVVANVDGRLSALQPFLTAVTKYVATDFAVAWVS